MHNIDYKLLLKLNGLNKEDYIYPEQILLIPKENYKVLITKNGDTLSNISNEYNLNIDELINENRNISLSPEQIIIIKNKNIDITDS